VGRISLCRRMKHTGLGGVGTTLLLLPAGYGGPSLFCVPHLPACPWLLVPWLRRKPVSCGMTSQTRNARFAVYMPTVYNGMRISDLARRHAGGSYVDMVFGHSQVLDEGSPYGC